jgi:two-component system response regulator RegX3
MYQAKLSSMADRVQPALVLVVEDDDLSNRYTTLALERLGYEVIAVATGAEAFDALGRARPDVILLDIELPDTNGIFAVPRLRELTSAPIIFVSAQADELSKVMALDAGGDDYVTKPFTVAELAARIRVVLRRAAPAATDSHDQLEAGQVLLDLSARTLTVHGTQVALTAREFDLLQLLMQQSHRVLRRQEIFDALWGADFIGDTSALDGYILHLRQKLEVDPRHPLLISTVHGVGYRFTAPN